MRLADVPHHYYALEPFLLALLKDLPKLASSWALLLIERPYAMIDVHAIRPVVDYTYFSFSTTTAKAATKRLCPQISFASASENSSIQPAASSPLNNASTCFS